MPIPEAKHARRTADQVRAERQRQRVREERKAVKTTAQEADRQFPSRMREVVTCVRVAVKSGETTVSHRMYIDRRAGQIVVDKIKQRLEDKGYTFHAYYREEESNMGDFSAPYWTTEKFFEITVSWNK